MPERRIPMLILGRTPGINAPLHLASSGPDRRVDAIATISHELRNSLGVVRNAAGMLRLDAREDSIDQARVLIERHVAQMCRHVDDLMELASSPTRRPNTLHRSHIDLRAILEFSIAAITPDVNQRGHRLVVELPAAPVWVHADSARLEQVFFNILINAAKHTPNGGHIVLSLECENIHARIRIRDSGIGIESAMLSRVFEMYSQAQASESCPEGGRGIGLALVRDLIEKHGGTVQVSSGGPGHGSEVTVTVPISWASAPVRTA